MNPLLKEDIDPLLSNMNRCVYLCIYTYIHINIYVSLQKQQTTLTGATSKMHRSKDPAEGHPDTVASGRQVHYRGDACRHSQPP